MTALFYSVIAIMAMTPITIWSINYREVVVSLPSTYGHTISNWNMYLLSNIIGVAIRQGNQDNNLRMIFKLILLKSLNEFNEDNKYTVGDWVVSNLQPALDEYELNIALYTSCDYDTHQPNTIIPMGRKAGFPR